MAARVTAFNEGHAAKEAMCKEIRTEVRNSEAAIRRRINKLEILQAKTQVRMANLFILEEDEEFTVKIDEIQNYFKKERRFLQAEYKQLNAEKKIVK